MALKKLIEIDEKFPVAKKSRLGAAPPADDVLDNVGEPELTPRVAPAHTDTVSNSGEDTDDRDASEASSPRASATKKRERVGKRVGQGGTRDSSIYGRRYRKTGRGFQFGARVTPEFADGMKLTAAARNMTMGELLEEMRRIYDSIHAIADDRKVSASDVLSELKPLK